MDAETLRRTTQRWKERILEDGRLPPARPERRAPAHPHGRQAPYCLSGAPRQGAPKIRTFCPLGASPTGYPGSPQRLLCCHERPM
eukprot:1333851-Prymnesium_polylepis.1